MQKFDFFQHHKNVLIKNVQVYQKQSPFLNVWARGPKLGFFHRTTVHHAYYYCGLGHVIVIIGGNSQSWTILRHFPWSPACAPPPPPLLPSLVSVSFLTFVSLDEYTFPFIDSRFFLLKEAGSDIRITVFFKPWICLLEIPDLGMPRDTDCSITTRIWN